MVPISALFYVRSNFKRTMNKETFIIKLKQRIDEIQNYYEQAGNVKDYPQACFFYGALIQMRKFLKEIEDG